MSEQFEVDSHGGESRASMRMTGREVGGHHEHGREDGCEIACGPLRASNLPDYLGVTVVSTVDAA